MKSLKHITGSLFCFKEDITKVQVYASSDELIYIYIYQESIYMCVYIYGNKIYFKKICWISLVIAYTKIQRISNIIA